MPIRSLLLFLVLAAGLLAGLGALSAALPATLRRPVLLPLVAFGLGGGFVLERLRHLFDLSPPDWLRVLLLGIAPVAYAVAGSAQLVAQAPLPSLNDAMAERIIESVTASIDADVGSVDVVPPSSFLRWTTWRWQGTWLAQQQAAAIAVYVAESLLAIGAGWWLFRDNRPDHDHEPAAVSKGPPAH